MTSTRKAPKKGLPLRLLAVILISAAVDAAMSFQVSRWAYGWLPVPASTAAPLSLIHI